MSSETRDWLVKGATAAIYVEGPYASVTRAVVTNVGKASVTVKDAGDRTRMFNLRDLYERGQQTWTQHYVRLAHPDDPRVVRLSALLEIRRQIKTLVQWSTNEVRKVSTAEAADVAKDLAGLLSAYAEVIEP